ncbi:hypothetical protein ACQ4PT_061223 [Festuca glaucescens]
MTINMECDGHGLVCAESKLAGNKEGRREKSPHDERLVILRRCEPIVRFSCCSVRYADCRRNHAASTGGLRRGRMPGVHRRWRGRHLRRAQVLSLRLPRSFHRRVQVYEVAWDCESDESSSSSSS